MAVSPAVAATNSWVVTSDGDSVGACTPFLCSLRAAITAANASAADDLITFNISPAGPHTISIGAGAANGLPAITGSDITIDATTQPGGAGHGIRIDDPDVGGGESGLVLQGQRITIRGFVITRFDGFGLLIGSGSSGDVIEGNWIGTRDGTTNDGTGNDGIHIMGVGGNVIGGSAPADRNVVSAVKNGQDGIEVQSSSDNVIAGNYVGMTADGLGRLPNADSGIEINGVSSRNRVGGLSAGERNIVSGNSGIGVQLLGIMRADGTCSAPQDNVVEGNYLGLNANGVKPGSYGNQGAGLEMGVCAQRNTVGGTAAGARNVVSGNHDDGVQLDSAAGPGGTAAVCNNTIQGNYIGSNPSGTVTRPNIDDGVDLDRGSCNNLVGGTAPGAGNLIVGNAGDGVDINSSGTNGNVVQGNVIGLAADGATAIPNLQNGVYIRFRAYNNVVDGNVISASGRSGVRIETSSATSNTIRNNKIGTTSDGSAIRGNKQYGVWLYNGTRLNRIEGNLITGSTLDGVAVEQVAGATSTTAQNTITRNRLQANGGLGIDLLPVDGVNANDGATSSSVGNIGLDFPVVTRATATSVQGAAPPAAVVEVFNAQPDGGETNGEGAVFLGSATAAASGAWCLDGVSVSGMVTATATDNAGNTSEFAVNVNTSGTEDVCNQTGDTTPPTIGTLAATAANSTSSFMLSWSAATDAGGIASYRLDVATSADFVNLVPGYQDRDVGTALSTTVTGLTPGTTYWARLRAIDPAGNVSANSNSVTITLPWIYDAFTRTVANGWGATDGLTWAITTAYAADYSANGAVGSIAATTTASRYAQLGVGRRDVSVAIKFRFVTLPTASWHAFYALARMGDTGNWYALRVRSVTGAADDIEFNANSPATGIVRIGSTAVVPELAAGGWYWLRLEVVGDGTTTSLRGRLWADGATEPDAWTITATDTTASLQGAAGAGLRASASATSQPPKVDVDTFSVSPATTAPPAPGPSPPQSTDPAIAAAGDIACDPNEPAYNNGLGTATDCHQKLTSDLLVNDSFAGILTLGDNQYYCGSSSDFAASFGPSWGRVKSLIHPVPGNHEYAGVNPDPYGGTDCAADARGYFGYFGAAAGDPTKGYYSFDIGSWHLIALNSECYAVAGCGAGSAQETWLRGDLAAHPRACTLAYWHRPRFSSGPSGGTTDVSDLWKALYDANAEIVLSGHDHAYERFAPQNGSGALDNQRGIREFVVGTGGRSHYAFPGVAANSEVRNAGTSGVLKLTLHPTSYDWKFVPERAGGFADSGSTACH